MLAVLRSLLWTILLPGFFAGYLPWRYFGLSQVRFDDLSASQVLGLFLIACGAALLGACIFEFARSGRGTLSPLDPPRQLVVRGLYRYVRNPMYLSVTVIVLGEVLVTRSPALGGLVSVCEPVRDGLRGTDAAPGILVPRSTNTAGTLAVGFPKCVNVLRS